MAIPDKEKTTIKISVEAKELWKTLVAPDRIDDTESELFDKTLKIVQKAKTQEVKE